MQSETYKLEELARAAKISARTVRYYVQRGLLPAPAFRGKDTAYSDEHLVRLRAIKRLQEAYFPLDAIVAELARRSIEEIKRLAEGKDLPSREDESPARKLEHEIHRAHVRAGRVHRRISIAPGVELDVAEDAPADSIRLVERLLMDLGAK